MNAELEVGDALGWDLKVYRSAHTKENTTLIGIAGLGVVGGALAEACELAGVSYRGYDPGKGMSDITVLRGCSPIFIQVGTPESNGDLDSNAVWGLMKQLIDLPIQDDTILCIKSTVPPGTNDELQEAYPQYRFASVPEFLIQENPLHTFLHPDRVIIGARSELDKRTLQRVLKSIIDPLEARPLRFILMKPIEAELLKLAANTMLAAKVSLANELAGICRAYGVEWSEIQEGVGADHRIGPSHLTVTARSGFGGACFPKDLHGLIAAAYRKGYSPHLLVAIDELNDRVRFQAESHAAAEKAGVRRGGSA